MRLISHGYLCRRRHKVAMIAELNLKIQLAVPPTQSVCGMGISMKIFVYNMREFDEKAFFDKFSVEYGVEYAYTTQSPCLENADMAKGYDCVDIITTITDAQLIDRFKELGVKCITTRTIGFDHIDIKHAREVGVGVTHVTYSPSSVADYTIMLILMGLRKINYIMQKADVQDFTLNGKMGKELPNCTVGVIGTGKIGRTVIKHLSGFGSKILAYDIYPNDAVKEYAQYTDLETLIKQSDVITLHAPATDDNYHMIDKKAIGNMKDGVVIINCARGALIDTDALIEGIESRKVGFAGLDVVEHESGLYYFDRSGEPLGNARLAILKSYSNVLVSPHTAFYTDEAVSNMVENSIIGALRYINNDPNKEFVC